MTIGMCFIVVLGMILAFITGYRLGNEEKKEMEEEIQMLEEELKKI